MTRFGLPQTRGGDRVVVLCAVLVLLCSSYAEAQVLTAPLESAHGPSQFTYVVPAMLPSPAMASLNALGSRLIVAGLERITLAGTYADSGGTHAAQLVWQAPGSVYFAEQGASTPLILNSATGLVNGSAMTSAQSNILESLLDDGMETFLYGFQRGAGVRYLGGLFRADGLTTPGYQGPWYGIYTVAAPVQAQPDHPSRLKSYYFDSKTGLLAKTVYLVSGNGSNTAVTTEFSNWTSTAGQSFPGMITRTENGTTVFTFRISSATVGPTVNDGLFTGN